MICSVLGYIACVSLGEILQLGPPAGGKGPGAAHCHEQVLLVESRAEPSWDGSGSISGRSGKSTEI